MGRPLAPSRLLTILLICLLACACGGSRQVSPRRAALAATISTTRPVEGRLTGGFRHVPYAQVPQTAASSGPLSRSAGPRRVESATGETSGSFLADHGVKALLEGDADTAVACLEAATRREPDQAVHWSDLAAALLERGSARREAHDSVQALAAARRAVALAPDLPEALFNRALALERLALRDDALTAWKEYRERHPGGGWEEEAAARLRALAQPTPAERWERLAPELDRAAASGDEATLRRLVAEFTQPARERVEDQLLPAWAEAHLAGRAADAARALAVA